MYRDYENAADIQARLCDLYAEMIEIKAEIDELEDRLNFASQDEESDEMDC